LLEVWIFDFDEDLYDKVIETELLHFIRPEAKFPDLQSLTAQVKADAEVARSVLVLLNQKVAAAGDSCGLWNC
jgi:riboflavin kinase/FMN adenylyltransferase